MTSREPSGLIASEPGLPAGKYLTWFLDEFGCEKRAAKDALRVFREAGYVAVDLDDRDRRRRCYRVSERGAMVLEHRAGPAVLRFARELFSACRQRRPGETSASLRERLERCEATMLHSFPAGELFEAEPIPRYESILPPPEKPLAEIELPLQPFVRVGSCKVCRSPYRDEIDLRLVAGHPQAQVRRQFNTLVGQDYFSASGMSRHLRQHVTEHTPQIRALLQQRVDRAEQNLELEWERLNEIIAAGVQAMQAGIITVKPRDMLRVYKTREQRENRERSDPNTLTQIIFEFQVFIECVREVGLEVFGEEGGEEYCNTIIRIFHERQAREQAYERYAARRRLLEPDFSWD